MARHLNFAKEKERQRVQASNRAAIDKREFDRDMHRALLDAARKETSEPIASKPVDIVRVPTFSGPNVQVSTMQITPEQATVWLEGNTHNRPLRQLDVERIAHEIGVGKWLLNGESIIFDYTGRLLDGQHRLWACVEAELPIESVVVFGVDPETFTTIDKGRKRTGSDYLAIDGVQMGGVNRSLLASTVNQIYRYRNGLLFHGGSVEPSTIVAIVRNEPGVVKWVEDTQHGVPMPLRRFGTTLAALLHMVSKTYPNEAQEFLQQWKSGADLAPTSPVLALRTRVLSKAPSESWHRMYIAASAWNAFIANRPLTKLGGRRGDRFPPIKGA